jgi:hypothetical protein
MKPEQAQDEEDDDDKTDEIDDAFHGRVSFALQGRNVRVRTNALPETLRKRPRSSGSKYWPSHLVLNTSSKGKLITPMSPLIGRKLLL